MPEPPYQSAVEADGNQEVRRLEFVARRAIEKTLRSTAILQQLCGRTWNFDFLPDEVINRNEPNPLSGTMNMTNRNKGFFTLAAQTILINFYLDIIGFSFGSYDDE
jgi:hypothetical protein